MNILADTFVFKKHNTKVTFKVYIFGQGDSFIDMIVDFNIFLSMRRNTLELHGGHGRQRPNG